MHVAAADADLGVVVGQILRHAFRQGGDEDALVIVSPVADLG